MKKYILIILLISIFASVPSSAVSFYDFSNVETVSDEGVKISFANQSLRVIGGIGETVEVYNVTGCLVYSKRLDSNDQSLSLRLSKGCYIVKVGKVARKISVP